VGFAQWQLVLPYGWTTIAAHSLVPHWLIAQGIKGNLLRSVLFACRRHSFFVD
jgi:hypothetical protein